MAPYLKFCDMCGSIQRSVRGDGLPIPPDKFDNCQVCGEPVPEDEMYCEACLQAMEPVVVKPPTTRTQRRIKVAAATFGGISVAAVGASVAAMVYLGGATLFVIILSFAGVVLGVSVWLLISISRPPKYIVEVYKPVQPGERSRPIRQKIELKEPEGPTQK